MEYPIGIFPCIHTDKLTAIASSLSLAVEFRFAPLERPWQGSANAPPIKCVRADCQRYV